MPKSWFLASVIVAVTGILVRMRAGVIGEAKSRHTVRIDQASAQQDPVLHFEWLDPVSGIDPAMRDELLRSVVVAGDFCRAHPEGCATFVDQFTEMLTPENHLAQRLLDCRIKYETSSSSEVCDAGRRMIVEKENTAQGRVIYVGFETGKSTEPECVALQKCLRDVFAGAALRWPQGYEGRYLSYGQAPWIPGYHPRPRSSYRERYEGLLKHAQEGLDFNRDVRREIDLTQISDEKRFSLDYQRITCMGKKHDAEMMLRAIDSGTGALFAESR